MSPSFIDHPCYHKGYNLTLKLRDIYDSPCVDKPTPFDPLVQVTFSGTGDSANCMSLIEKIVNVTKCSLYPDCGFGGVYQPPINGEFFVSVFCLFAVLVIQIILFNAKIQHRFLISPIKNMIKFMISFSDLVY